MPRVSIILPTRDRGDLLPRAVASVVAQTETDWELVIVDANRREPPVARHPGLAAWQDDPRLHIVAAPQTTNVSGARNVGLALATGRWITYLDDDDAYRPDKIARQLALAEASAAPLVLCGARYHLVRRLRRVQCSAARWQGDELLLHARWNPPLLLHRATDQRFDETLSASEDIEFAHRLLARAGVCTVPVVPEPLVEVYPQPGPRVNTCVAPVRPAAARVLARGRGTYSRAARRRHVLRTLLAIAKLRHERGRCLRLAAALVIETHGRDWRVAANALAVSFGLWRGGWVS